MAGFDDVGAGCSGGGGGGGGGAEGGGRPWNRLLDMAKLILGDGKR